MLNNFGANIDFDDFTAMSDAVGSSSCCNQPESSPQDVHNHQQQPPKPPEYSQCAIDGIDTVAQSPTTLLGCHQQTMPSAPPPKYEHPPAYAVGWTPGQDSLNEVRINGLPDSSVTAACREYLRARPAPSYSSPKYIILSCFVFWLCGFVCGAVAFILAVLARRKSTSRARHFNRASMSLSLIGIVLGFVLYVFLLILVSYSRTWECGVEDTGWNQTLYGRRSTTTTLPEMSSPACYVVGNETACFGFASSFTAEWCSAIGGSFVDVNSSSSATLSSMHVCYHNVCSDYVVNTSCFQYRTTGLDRDACRGINGYFIVEPSGRSCYYNDCPGFTASNNKCYQYRESIRAATCNNGFYENGYCYYNNKP